MGQSSGNTTQIIVAIIGLLGVLGAALITNWDNFQGDPDIQVVSVALNPSPPVQRKEVDVVVTIKNIGKGNSGYFEVSWWPGENFPSPHIWKIDNLAKEETKSLRFTYEGYVSWYGSLTTKVEVDPSGATTDSNRANNEWKKDISVTKARTVTIPQRQLTTPQTQNSVRDSR